MGAEIIPVAVGDLVLGVRANEPEVTTQLRALLADHLVDHDGPAGPPPNVSVALGRRRGEKHQLCRGGVVVLRTTSVGRLLRAVPLLLDGYAAPPDGVVRLNAWVLVGGDGAVLVDRRYSDSLERIEPRLARLGYRRWDGYCADVDPTAGEVGLGPPRVAFAPAAAADLASPGDREVPPTDTRRRPVRSLVTIEDEDAALSPSPARRLSEMAPLVAHHRRTNASGLGLLSAWLQDGRVKGGPRLDDGGLLAAVSEA